VFLELFAESRVEHALFPPGFDPETQDDDAESNHASPSIKRDRRANYRENQPGIDRMAQAR
jgi:hypothetical protein